MTKKIEVEPWFDKWVKKASEHIVEAVGSDCVTELLVNKIAQAGWVADFYEAPEVCHDFIRNEPEFFKRRKYVQEHKLELIKAVIDGYQVREEMGYVVLDGTKDIANNVQYAIYRSCKWMATWHDYRYPEAELITRAQYDKAPAWVKACAFIPKEGGGQDAE